MLLGYKSKTWDISKAWWSLIELLRRKKEVDEDVPLFSRCSDVFDMWVDKVWEKVKKAHFMTSQSYQRNNNFKGKQAIQISLNHDLPVLMILK